ncbi:MAG: MFS transporter [Nitrospirae bacterium]|nr:MFS transporter [Nitrospirota bacterium]
MTVSDLFKVKNPEIRALHFTWIAFFISFYTWFNMAPLATTMIKELGWLTMKDIKLFAICNVALTIPARVFFGMLQDKYGPRKCYSVLMILMAIPALAFAFGNSGAQLLVTRLILSCIGASFSIGIHMTALWFKPRDIGFAEGFYAGWGNFGSAGAAMTLPWVALYLFGGGSQGWRYALAANAIVMLGYGILYFFVITDGPAGAPQHKPRKTSAMEVSTWFDMIKLIIVTIPLWGILSILIWRIQNFGYLSADGAIIAYAVIVVVILYQIIQILRVNIPILKKGVPEDDKYKFNNVISLNTTYFANFGAELAVVSMLPAFFESTFTLTPTAAGLIASSFAFVNLIARPLGGFLSDKLSSRKLIMTIYMFGIALGFLGMGFISSAWPIILATILTVACSMFVQGAEGATFGVIPMIKRRITGQIAGMAGAYGNVGAVFYLFLYTFVTPSQFFLIIAAGAFVSFLTCIFLLKEPEGSFAEEYHMSSVDREMLALHEGESVGHH